MKRFFSGILAALVLAVIGILFAAYSGAVDVSATGRHLPGMDWFLSTTRDSSVEHRAESIRVPPDLDELSRRQRGFAHYHEMCEGCHGAPGVPRSEVGEGLDPKPPELQRGVDGPREVFWVVKHGIRMTGMPAFGPSHDDEKLWDIVAFVEQLPDTSADIYAQEVHDAEHGNANGAAGDDAEGGHPAVHAGSETPAGGEAHPDG